MQTSPYYDDSDVGANEHYVQTMQTSPFYGDPDVGENEHDVQTLQTSPYYGDPDVGANEHHVQTLQTSPYYGDSDVGANEHHVQTMQTSPYSGDPDVGASANTVQTSVYEDSKKLQAKLARANRKQVLANKKANPSSSSSRRQNKKTYSVSIKGSDQDDYFLYTQENVKLELLTGKVLTSSDVGDLGRILLPKREVEQNLPGLATQEGVEIVLREVFSNTEWRMKYRFWANHKGNIYLFDQCAEFVKKNSLEAGDHLKIYQDEQRNLYFAVKKKDKRTIEPIDFQDNESESYLNRMFEATQEEDPSWRELMEELDSEEHDNGKMINFM
ncbi:hypothetical protein QVD17_18064 [Tagetes erecta]|uniref:TF-B3 domain-containing protein n=1 Tax=Tagetes erecta TaxID=13708 RepID=A0AAD8NVF3_TARER|nr:hypothetical protein QVD17_18064 [Tagetes erecta]